MALAKLLLVPHHLASCRSSLELEDDFSFRTAIRREWPPVWREMTHHNTVPLQGFVILTVAYLRSQTPPLTAILDGVQLFSTVRLHRRTSSRRWAWGYADFSAGRFRTQLRRESASQVIKMRLPKRNLGSLYSSVVQADSRSSSSTSMPRCCPNISSRTRTRPVLDIGRSNAASSPASGP